MIDCKEAVRRMWAYLDAGLPTGSALDLEAHLDTCRRCCGELEFSRHLRAMIAARVAAPALPAATRTRIEYLLTGADDTVEGPI
jgi:mycothiol system anti-sigma-R factor